MKSVAIIGSRRVNESQFNYLVAVAEAFARRGWVVRTGCAEGADNAAMIGCRNVRPDLLDIYLPWASYNKHLQKPSDGILVYNPKEDKEWTESVSRYHPAPHRLSRGAFSLMARNWGILMDEQPVDVVVAMPMSVSDVGGTGQGMRIAKDNGIPLFTVCTKEERQRLKEFINKTPREGGETVAPETNQWKMKIVDGDATQHKGLIIHQVNCQGVMGAGIAKQIRDKWPIVYNKYKAFVSPQALGKLQVVRAEHDVLVGNLFGQNTYGRTGVHTDYEAFRSACKAIKKFVGKYGGMPIGIPYNIGCGLAGGDWATVSKILEEELNGLDVTLYKFQ